MDAFRGLRSSWPLQLLLSALKGIAEAETQFLEIRQSLLGEEHPDFLRAVDGLTAASLELNETEGEEILRCIYLAEVLRVLGPEL